MILVQLELFQLILSSAQFKQRTIERTLKSVRSIDPIPEQEYQYNDENKSLLALLEDKSLLNYHVSEKACRNVLPNILQKINLEAVPFILIPEKSQPNAHIMISVLSLIRRVLRYGWIKEAPNIGSSTGKIAKSQND